MWNGSEYGLSWHDDKDGNDEIYFTRLSANGSKIGGDVRVTNNSSGSNHPSLVWTGSEYGMAWSEHSGLFTVSSRFTRLDIQGVLKGSILDLGNARCGVGYTSLVSPGNNFAVIWEDSSERGIENCHVKYAVFECGDDGP